MNYKIDLEINLIVTSDDVVAAIISAYHSDSLMWSGVPLLIPYTLL